MQQDKLSNFIKEISSIVHSNPKFKYTRFRSTFVLEDLENLQDPDQGLKNCLQHCIDRTREESKKQSMEVDRIGVSISSNLLDYDIYVPIRKITENTTDAVLNLFLKVSQSKGRQGSLLGEPFTLTITGIRSTDLPKQRKIIGSGKRGPRINLIKRKIDDACIMKIDNDDRYCLFFALEIMRIYSSKELTQRQFSRYKNNKEMRRRDVHKLLSKANIPKNLPHYDAIEFCPIVQQYYDETYGFGKFKIFIFRDHGFKPIYKSDVEDYQNPILLYHHDHHFDGIRTISKFFGSTYYCLSCESPYSFQGHHDLKCKSRCINCSGVGPKFPCQTVPGYTNSCDSCNKIFMNSKCYERHVKNNFCNKSKRCVKKNEQGVVCGVIYRVDLGHECGSKYCFACHQKHKEGECYIQKYYPKKKNPIA